MDGQWKRRCDNNHLGHFFVNYMRKIPNEICQINAATGEQETCGSVLGRSMRLARRLGRLGLRPGDVVVLGGRNHLDVHIPFYAGMMAGLPVAGIDPALKSSELKNLLEIVEPKLAFCEYAMFEEYKKTVHKLKLDTKIVTFGGGESSFAKLMEQEEGEMHEDEYQVATFNTDEVYCWLVSTSGSTGRSKVVALTHSHIMHMVDSYSFPRDKNGLRRTAMNLSTLHWISGFQNALLMPIHHIKVQTSAPLTTEHIVDIINKYKPAGTLATPTSISPLMHHENCDLTCFDVLKMGGSKTNGEFVMKLRTRVRPDTVILQAYGQTESGGAVLRSTTDMPFGNAGLPVPMFEAKLVEPDTGKEILEPNVTGELYVRGPTMACYYNNPKETKDTYTNDGYFKTGDLFYKDVNGFYFFVERLKMLLKYKNYQIVPSDVEEVILTLPGVEAVCVTGVPHAHDGERAVACVVRQSGVRLTAQDVKDHVAKHLSASKHLHGGVVFLDALPTTSTGKVARLDVKKLVLTAHRE